jgi:uncharacterized protein
MLFVEDLPIKELNDRIILNVKVTPKAAKSRFGNIFNNSLKIYVTAAPESGQANKAVIELISGALKISKSSVIITSGQSCQNKIIEIVGDPKQLIKNLMLTI